MAIDQNDLGTKLRAVHTSIAQLDRLVVGFSGGVDSALLSDLASDALGTRALVVTAVSPSLAQRDRQACREVAMERGWRHQEVLTHEVDDEAYRRNDASRCYVCRDTMFRTLDTLRDVAAGASIAVGTVADDDRSDRPGERAADRHGVLRPLARAGLTKDEVRTACRQRGLSVWDRPANACQSSRIARGLPVTAQRLARVEQAEDLLVAAGFAPCRVRDHGTSARVEVDPADTDRLTAQWPALRPKLLELGWPEVTIQADGLRVGARRPQLPIVLP